jgi:D-aminopeptidase
LEPGPRNTITDVAGVRVGHRTVIEGSSIRTGVTAILPHGGDLFREKVPAAVFVGNGFGKAAGFLQVDELGTLETPIVLTNTLAVGTAVRTVVAWTLEQPGHENVRSVNAVVGETNDGLLNDIRSLPIRPEHVRAAIQAATRSPEGAPVAEGSVGAGTGTRALGWKGGIGTASRRLPAELSGGGAGWTVGALVQSNFGGVLRIDGVPVGELLGRYSFRDVLEGEGADAADAAGRGESSGDGSCMIVLATDAPLDARNLGRLARRAVLALGRVGSFMSNGSGDFVVAFSTANRVPERSDGPVRELTTVRNDAVSPLFLAAVEAVEEAVYNSLTRAETVTGHRGRAEAIPVDRLREVLDEHRVRK